MNDTANATTIGMGPVTNNGRASARTREWLETDGLGGFACGTVSGLRTRRYHGLLVSALSPPTGRQVLVSGMDVEVETPGGLFSLSAQHYAPDVIGGDGEKYLESFTTAPWPTWIFRLPDGTRVQHELLMRAGAPQVYLGWTLLTPSRAPAAAPGLAWARLVVRPFLAGRDFHALMLANPTFSFDPEIGVSPAGAFLRYRPYPGGPTVAVSSSGAYRHQPHWYRDFVYEEERRRGLDFQEDLGSPGEWAFELGAGTAALIFSTERAGRAPSIVPAIDAWTAARDAERARRAALDTALDRAADQYIVARRGGKTIIAGYPWFGDWGRDTFIAVRGLCLASGRVNDALAILSAWAGLVSEGMLPNFFPDQSGHPEYNAVDASLWYVVAAAETINAAEASPGSAPDFDPARRRALLDACEAILHGYAGGTRYGIRATDDGLLAAGERGQQLTWMDARVDGREITPRIGKPVEVQALWLNALAAIAAFGTANAPRWGELFVRGRASFEARFWDDAHGRLYDVVDTDHVPGAVDATLRPNQIFAVGGLPIALLEGDRARRVVDAVEQALLTPLGLRSLAPTHPDYRPHYRGGVVERDGAYHQGTVWPWLLGPFVEAVVRVHGDTPEARRAARARFLAPVLQHLEAAGLGHVSEVADAEAPHTPGGCPFQAWSVGELLRLDRVVLRADVTDASRSVTSAQRPTGARPDATSTPRNQAVPTT